MTKMTMMTNMAKMEMVKVVVLMTLRRVYDLISRLRPGVQKLSDGGKEICQNEHEQRKFGIFRPDFNIKLLKVGVKIIWEIISIHQHEQSILFIHH